MHSRKKSWTVEPLHTFQIDIKEQITLSNQEQVSWINVADEGTTSHLKASIQTVRTASQVKLSAATYAINKVFKRWGLPQRIKIDNGYPLVNPSFKDIPTLTKLWWIGLGIEVVQNTVGRPQENGVVECLQGICHRWVHPITINSAEELQQKVDEISDFQRNHYQMPKKGMKTRIQCYPQLEQNPRKYNPDKFDIKKVWVYLEEQVWKRKIDANGVISFFAHRITVGGKHKGKEVYITFDRTHQHWIFRDTKGTFLRSSSKGVPLEEKIKDFAIMSKN